MTALTSRALTREELEFIVRVQHDTIVALLDQVAAAHSQIAEAYQAGRIDGEWAGELRGAEQAEQDMAEHWASIVRDVRACAGRPTFAERRAAELERVRTGSQATGPELIERARNSWAGRATRPDLPTGLQRITWDGTWRPLRPDATWTAADENRFQAHYRHRTSGGKAA